MDAVSNTPSLTRYLYITFDVYHSLLKCLLISPKTKQVEHPEGNLRDLPEEFAKTLFWTYELYFSGFKEKTIQLLKDVSYMYPPKNDKIMMKLFGEYDQQYMDRTLHSEKNIFDFDTASINDEKEALLVANIVENLRHKIKFYLRGDFDPVSVTPLNSPSLHSGEFSIAYRSVNVRRFSNFAKGFNDNSGEITMKNYFVKNMKSKRCLIRVPYDISFIEGMLSIRTLVETPKVKHYHVLKNACLYESLKYDDSDHHISVRKTIIDSMYNGKWFYYCYNTPLWKQRIDAYNGQVNHVEKTIEFLGEEDEFYGKYDYEPDNNMHIIRKIAGV
jgi:hypothetical protein